MDGTQAHMDFFRLVMGLLEGVAGSIVECGVFEGNSLSCLASLAREENKRRQVWGYDLFGVRPTVPLSRLPDEPEVPMGRDLDFVKKRLTGAGWLSAHLIPGAFASTLVATPPPAPIALLHIDADLYQSYVDVLNILWAKTAKGGIIILDEYKSKKWFGARLAVDEFVAQHSDAVLHDDYRAYLLKTAVEGTEWPL